jgi:transcription antitermination factor NusG
MSNISHFALHTEPRSEFAIESHLRAQGFEAFCPTEKKTKRVSRYSKKTREVTYPQLPGYVIVGAPSEIHIARNWSEPLYITPKDRTEREDIRHYARRSGRVRKVLSDNGKAVKLTAADIRRLEMTSANAPNSSVIKHKAVRRGMDVEVTEPAHPFSGWTVKVQDLKGDDILTTVLMFNRPQKVKIPIAWVRPV